MGYHDSIGKAVVPGGFHGFDGSGLPSRLVLRQLQLIPSEGQVGRSGDMKARIDLDEIVGYVIALPLLPAGAEIKRLLVPRPSNVQEIETREPVTPRDLLQDKPQLVDRRAALDR